MPQVEITIGGRQFEVACQPGEERFLRTAAELLDAEATAIAEQIGRMPEGRMLLMAGLMLADKTVALEERLRTAEARAARLESEIALLPRTVEVPVEVPVEVRIEIPTIPVEVRQLFADIAAEAEALSHAVETLSQAPAPAPA
jgi:cell division protein ZapA